MESKRGKREGATLVEVMVAVLILGMVLVGISAAFVNGLRTVRQVNYISIATNALREEMEIVKGQSFSSLTNRTDAPFIGAVGGLSDLPNPVAELTILDYLGNDDIKEINLSLSWDDFDAEMTADTLVTLFPPPAGGTGEED